MTLAAPKPVAVRTRVPQFLFHDVSWEYYDQTLRELDRNRQHARVTYDDGRMEIMTLGDAHERAKKTIARLIETYSLEKDVPITALGSITCRRKRLRKGLEPDECYYVTTPAPPMSRKELNLNKYPPPDLAVEVDISASSIEREPIYGVLNVPEVWRYDGKQITFLLRQANGKYAASDRSPAFPELPLRELNRWVSTGMSKSQHAAVTALRDWLRAH